MSTKLNVGLLLFSILAFCAPSWAQGWEPEPRRFLKTYVHLSDQDLQHLTDGAVVVKLLPTKVSKEVAAAGVVRLKVPTDFFLREFRDIETFKKAPEVHRIRRLSNHPQTRDFEELILPAEDLRDLKSCRVGGCEVKLSAEMIRRMNTQGRGGELAKGLFSNLFHELLSNYVSSYMELGNSSMITYADKKPPESSAEEFMGILEASAFLEEYAPQLRKQLLASPGNRRSGADQFLYWSQEQFGLKSVASVTHVILSETETDDCAWHWIASKQIYASHYFEASLGLTILASDAGNSSATSFWLIYINRSRSDGLTGWFAALKRAIISRSLRSGMARNLRLIRKRMETKYASRGRPN